MSIRISLASFVAIHSDDGRLALLVNKNGLKKGKTVLAPIGGALEVDAAQGREIMAQLNLSEADFEKEPADVVDLRFTADEAQIDEIRQSFRSWDRGPARELREELVDETNLLTHAEIDASNFTLSFAGVSEERARSTRTGKADGQMTFRLVSVYDLTGGADITRKLEAAARQANPLVYFVTPAEIEAERTAAGAEIASITKSLLHPSPALG